MANSNKRNTAADDKPAAKAAGKAASARAAKPAAKAPAGKTKAKATAKPAAKATSKSKAAATPAANKPKKVAKTAAKKPAKAVAEMAAPSVDDAHRTADLRAGGALLQRLREQADDGDGGHGLSHAVLAKRLGITAARLKTLEGGGGGDGVSFALLQAAARACGLGLTIAIAGTTSPVAEVEPPAATPEMPQPEPIAAATPATDMPAEPSPLPDVSDMPADAEVDRRTAPDDGPLPPSRGGVGLQAALDQQGRNLLRTLDGLADGGREREIARRFRAGETPAAIATAMHLSQTHVVQLLRGMGFRTRTSDRHESGPPGSVPASSDAAPHERRSSLAALTGGDEPTGSGATITPISAGVRMGRRSTDLTITNGSVDLTAPTDAADKPGHLDSD